MRIYWLVFVLTILFSSIIMQTEGNRIYVNKTLESRYSLGKVMFVFIPIIFFLGLRSGVGDTPGYIDAFNSAPVQFNFENYDERAWGYTLLLRFCKAFLFQDFHLWLLLLILISTVLISTNLSKYSPNIRISLFLFIASTEFVFLINGIRQCLAVCICFYALRYILERKPIKYVLLILLAMSIHITAAIMLPVYFIAIAKPWKKKMWFLILILIIICMYSTQFMEQLDSAFIGDSYYGYYMNMLYEAEGVNIFRTAVMYIPVIMAFIYRKNIERINDPCMNICINISVLNALCFTFASTIGGNLTGRMGEYFNIFNLLLYPMIFERCVSEKDEKLIKVVFVIAYLVFFYYQMQITWGGLEYISDILHIQC